MEERTQQPKPYRHGHRANSGTRYLYGRGKTTKGPKWTLLPVQPKGAHRQILPTKKRTSCGSIHVQHPGGYGSNSRTRKRRTKAQALIATLHAESAEVRDCFADELL